MAHVKKFVKGTINIMFFMIISALFGYLMKFVFSRMIKVEEIGLFYSVLGFITFFFFIRDLGLADSLVYFIPRFLIKNERSKIKSSILFTFKIQLIIGSIFYIFLLFISKGLAKFYFKDLRAQTLILILGLYYVLDGVVEILYKLFVGYRDFFLSQGTEFSITFFSSVSLVIFAFIGISIKWYGLSYLVSSIATIMIFGVLFFKKKFPFFSSTKTSKNIGKRMLKYSLPAMVGSFAGQIFNQQSIFFLTFFLGLEAVGLYVMALSLAKISIYFLKALSIVFIPTVASLWKQGKKIEINKTLFNIFSYAYLVCMPLALSIIIFSPQILKLIYTEKFLPAVPLLQLYAVYFLLYNFGEIIRHTFLSIGRPKISRNLTMVSLIVNIILNVILIPKIGLIGVAFADIFAAIITAVYGSIIFSKMTSLRIPFYRLGKIFVISIIFSILTFFLNNYLLFNEYTNLILSLFLSGSVYLFLVFFFKIVKIKDILNLIRT
ncbi:oligosaccharide flippase family protein [archaeon]|jgi:O-antigen/teichoic acid export membrane protein|nr:oligosaccharide flippase family protein [archaeon]MBT4460646.1 oligosaccharide flippase family protein [archaeon]MBT7439610.1 oligosaccharide flippase family protein [archaeon]